MGLLPLPGVGSGSLNGLSILEGVVSSCSFAANWPDTGPLPNPILCFFSIGEPPRSALFFCRFFCATEDEWCRMELGASWVLCTDANVLDTDSEWGGSEDSLRAASINRA